MQSCRRCIRASPHGACQPGWQPLGLGRAGRLLAPDKPPARTGHRHALVRVPAWRGPHLEVQVSGAADVRLVVQVVAQVLLACWGGRPGAVGRASRRCSGASCSGLAWLRACCGEQGHALTYAHGTTARPRAAALCYPVCPIPCQHLSLMSRREPAALALPPGLWPPTRARTPAHPPTRDAAMHQVVGEPHQRQPQHVRILLAQVVGQVVHDAGGGLAVAHALRGKAGRMPGHLWDTSRARQAGRQQDLLACSGSGMLPSGASLPPPASTCGLSRGPLGHGPPAHSTAPGTPLPALAPCAAAPAGWTATPGCRCRRASLAASCTGSAGTRMDPCSPLCKTCSMPCLQNPAL